jgi:aminomethyltransferase
MVPFAGWEMPVQYRGVKEEHLAVRGAAGLFDVSHMGEMELEGPGAGALVDSLITNAAGKLEDGQALYTVACNEGGTILDDLIVYRRAADRWLVVCNASNRDKMVAHFSKHASGLRSSGQCTFEDTSDRIALLALQGPKALTIAAAGWSGTDLNALGSFRLADGELFGVRCTAARTGYTGEDGIEIFCASDGAAELWRALIEAGTPHGIQAAGLGARDTLRLEARLCLYGNDIDETTHPFEAGLAWTVKLDKGEFVGRAALQRIKGEGLGRKLVGFEMTGRGIARHGYPLLDPQGKSVGICTSGSPSPTLGTNIGLGYLPVAMAEPGSEFLVDSRGRTIGARVVTTPFYKRPR